MRKTRGIKSQIATINKRLGDLPPLCTLSIEDAGGRRYDVAQEPIDALIRIIDEMAGTPTLKGTIVGFVPDDPTEPASQAAQRAYAGLCGRKPC